MIAGNTGSGKTTTLNAIFSFVDDSERIIITEETPEINIFHKHKVSLRVNKSANIDMKDLIKSTLRLRPDRLIIGEIRDQNEVEAFVDTILAGQGKGSIATFHAQSSLEALQRLRKLGVLEQDLNTIDLIIIQRRWTQYNISERKSIEIRKIVSVSEIIDGKIYDIFKYDYKNNEWIYTKPKKIKSKIEVTFNQDYDKLFLVFEKKLHSIISDNKINKLGLEEFSSKIRIKD